MVAFVLAFSMVFSLGLTPYVAEEPSELDLGEQIENDKNEDELVDPLEGQAYQGEIEENGDPEEESEDVKTTEEAEEELAVEEEIEEEVEPEEEEIEVEPEPEEEEPEDGDENPEEPENPEEDEDGNGNPEESEEPGEDVEEEEEDENQDENEGEEGEEGEEEPGEDEAEENEEGEGEDQEAIPLTNLIVNHIEVLGYDETIIDTEIIDELEVGSVVFGLDFVREWEGVYLIEVNPQEIVLLEEVENVINIYYGSQDGVDIAEDPDFPLGEGQEVESPYIEEFRYGELGPFEEVNYRNFNLFNSMNEESYPDAINNIPWPDPGSLALDKFGTEVPGTGNQWEITLELEGIDKAETSDIVLVIDRSGSMAGSKLADAKNAAQNFVQSLLDNPNKDNIRIAIVSFAGDVNINSNFRGYDGKNALIGAINSISANGGTHIQAGLRQANAMLNGSTADYKNIVLLGDGAATYSYRPNNPNSYLEYWKTEWFRAYYRTTPNIPGSGFNYNNTVGDGMSEHTQYQSGGSIILGTAYSNNYRHGAHAVAEAGFGKSMGYEVYSIALDAGTEGNWTLQNIASSGNYYSTPSSSNLNAIFQEIAGRLSNAATDAVVTDPLGSMYSIPGINATNYNSLISVSHGSVSYNDSNGTITWDIGTIREGTSYWMKYKVALDYSAEGGVYYPANKPTYIEYENIEGDPAKKYFPIPEFRLRALSVTKIVTGSGNKEFDILLEGPNGQYKKNWVVSLKSGETKSIKGLVPGTYTVQEIVPMNYKLLGMSGGGISHLAGNTYELVIGNNDWDIEINVSNEKDNDGWFWDDPDPKVNSFSVGVLGGTANLPKVNDHIYAELNRFIVPPTMEEILSRSRFG